MIDTHRMIVQLVNASFTQEQAEGVVELMQHNNAATYQDLATKADIKTLETDIKMLDAKITNVANEMGFLRWLLSLGFAALGLLILIVKL